MRSTAPVDEQQRRPCRVLVVHLRRGIRVEVRISGLEERTRRARDVVALVDGLRVRLAERVGEAPVELLVRQRREVVLAERVLQRRPGGAKRRERQLEHALRRGRVERDRRRAETAVREQLREQPAERVPDDDRRPVEPADDLLVVVDHVRNREPVQRRRVTAHLGRVVAEPQPGGRDHFVPLLAVALGPVLPAERRHPHAVDQDDRVRCRWPS